jgi:hypothetical protein
LKNLILYFLLTLVSTAAYSFSWEDWEGDVSSDWANANNWEGNSFPSGSERIRIDPGRYTNAPVISSNSSFNADNLRVESNGILTIQANMTFTDDVQIRTGGSVVISGGTVTVTGANNFSLEDDGSSVTISGGTLVLGQDFAINGDGDGVDARPVLTLSAGTLQVGRDLLFDESATDAPLFIMSGGYADIGRNIANSGGDASIRISDGVLEVSDNINMLGGDDSLVMSGGTIIMSGGDVDNDGWFFMSDGEFEVDGTVDLEGGGDFQFHDITVNTSEVFDQSGVSTMSISGDWDNDGTFNDRVAQQIFNGTSAQNISNINASGEEFYNLVINNTSSAGITLSDEVTVANSINFTDGVIHSSTGAELTIKNNVTVIGGTDASHVEGPMAKIGNQAFTFPVGDSGQVQPLSISAPSSGSDEFTAEYREVNPGLTYQWNAVDGVLDHVSTEEYWILDRTNGTSNVSVTLSWDANSDGVDNLSELRVARWNGSNWDDQGNSGTTGNTAAGTVTSNSVTTFSPFTLGSTTGNNPLPITLLAFDAHEVDQDVMIEWKTASEKNNAGFIIERSADGQSFYKIDELETKALNGNSSTVLDYKIMDENPLEGWNYYRLKQVDQDGSVKAYHIDVVQIEESEKESIVSNPVGVGEIYPNPYHAEGLHIPVNKDLDRIQLEVFDMTGRSLLTKEVKVQDSDVKLDMELPVGLYIIEFSSPESSDLLSSQKLIVN